MEKIKDESAIEILHRIRKEFGLRLDGIAERLGRSQSGVQKWNSGKRPIPESGRIQLLSLYRELSGEKAEEKPAAELKPEREEETGDWYAYCQGGLNTTYWERGKTEEEAYGRIWKKLQNLHGGLALGMLSSVVVFRDEQERIESWIIRTLEAGKAIRKGRLEAIGDWYDEGIIDFPHSLASLENHVNNPPYQVILENADKIEFLDGDRSYVGKIRLEAIEPLRDKFGQTADTETAPDFYYYFSDDQLAEANFDDSETGDFDEFQEWLEKNHADKISSVGDSGTLNGTAWSWEYLTYDPELGEAGFQKIIDEYIRSAEEKSESDL